MPLNGMVAVFLSEDSLLLPEMTGGLDGLRNTPLLNPVFVERTRTDDQG
jgi:hypothetical protein